jgi:DNA-binding NarL/FixJ family response regulator
MNTARSGSTRGSNGTPIDGGDAQKAVLLGNDPLWLLAVEHVLTEMGLDTAAKTNVPEELAGLVRDLQPDLVIADLDHGDTRAVTDVVSAAVAEAADLRVVVISLHSGPPRMDAAFAAGADAYVLKSAEPEDLAVAIRQAFSPSMYFPSAPSDDNGHAAAAGASLTRREREILKMVSTGASNADVARVLWVTEQTVKFHLSNVYRKIAVRNRTEAGRWAQVNGLLHESSNGDRPDAAVAACD